MVHSVGPRRFTKIGSEVEALNRSMGGHDRGYCVWFSGRLMTTTMLCFCRESVHSATTDVCICELATQCMVGIPQSFDKTILFMSLDEGGDFSLEARKISYEFIYDLALGIHLLPEFQKKSAYGRRYRFQRFQRDG